MSVQESYEIQVAVYDLSNGMARNLSAQFLGPNYQIDAIPHTGVIAYGMEYFYGGGIQCEEPTALRRSMGIMPIQVLSVGRTHVTKAVFDAWCRQKMGSGEYSMNSYDLLSHNCNTFSHSALTEGLKLRQGVPQWILDVPRKFLSSPMGQLVRPLLDNMQLGRVSGAQTMTSAAPFAGSAPSVAAPPPAAAAAAGANPWAQMPPVAPVSTGSSSTPMKATTTATANGPSLEILKTHNKPLLANETKTITMCVEKLNALTSGDAEAEDLRAVGQGVAQQTTLPKDQAVRVVSFLKRCLEADQKTTFVLMLVRLLALRHSSLCQPCLEWIVRNLRHMDAGGLKSPASRAMSWLALSNVLADQPDLLDADLETLVESSLQDVSPESQSRVEVRQAAAAFVYNTVLTPKLRLTSSDAELSDLHVSVLCASLESLDRETDETVRLRRLLAAGRILFLPIDSKQRRHEATAQLMSDLGFQDGLQAFAQKEPQAKSGKLAREVLYVLSG